MFYWMKVHVRKCMSKSLNYVIQLGHFVFPLLTIEWTLRNKNCTFVSTRNSKMHLHCLTLKKPSVNLLVQTVWYFHYENTL